MGARQRNQMRLQWLNWKLHALETYFLSESSNFKMAPCSAMHYNVMVDQSQVTICEGRNLVIWYITFHSNINQSKMKEDKV